MTEKSQSLIEEIKKSPCVIIYGAGNIGRAFYHMISSPCFGVKVFCFCVTKKQNDLDEINTIPVYELDELKACLPNAAVILAVTEHQADMQAELLRYTESDAIACGFESPLWNALYDEYLSWFFQHFGGTFQRLSENDCAVSRMEELELNSQCLVFRAKSHVDKQLTCSYVPPMYMRDLQVGASRTDQRLAELRDDIGDNLSDRNGSYCELTGMYWIWKHITSEYKGLYHYRRILDLDECMCEGKGTLPLVDVILPEPVISADSLKLHYAKYHITEDWEIMERVLAEQYPDYLGTAKKVFHDVVFYPGNIVIAKEAYFDEYCEWLFSILFEVEKMAAEKTDPYQRRYLGFLAERLTTLFFIHHADRFNIAHVKLKILD